MKHNFANAKDASPDYVRVQTCGLGSASWFSARHHSERAGLFYQLGWKRGPSSKVFSTITSRRSERGFSLVDALLASGILVIITAACLSAIFTNQVITRKVKEEAIAMGFLTKYVENVKALPFDSASPGLPLNYAYNINIPANTNWVALNTNVYYLFYPDLLWLSNRNPKMSVSVRQTTVSGVVHDKEFNVRFDWDPPMKKGGQLEVQVDFLRTANVPTL